MYKSDEIVEEFVNFFSEKDHEIVDSSPLIPRGDSTLLFTSAGMVQFKPLWAGEVPLEYRRAVSVQKCLRLSDLDEVGETYWHDTFFEMLGNFSFGDYFKEEAIKWGWEFLTETLGIKPEKLFISVYPDDEKSIEIWTQEVGVPKEKVVRHPDNFWGPAGGKGACGPDTEIFYDLGEEFGECEFDAECDRYIELWNIVFPQYDQKENERAELKNRGVDTGMGLERLAMILQDKPSIFETDLFFPIIEKCEDLYGIDYRKNRQPLNIISDHIRALVFGISEGIYPGNTGRGYVMRRLVRRALTVSQKIGIEDSFLHKLIPEVVSIMGNRYPELKKRIEQVTMILKSEEDSFLQTLSSGVSILNEIIRKKKEAGETKIGGEDTFKLYDTYGFPPELTEEIAGEEGLSVDKEGFREEMKKQRERAREEHEFEAGEQKEWTILRNEESKFIGYDREETETEIIAYRERNGEFELILKETPFYAERGGQVGDTGIIRGDAWKLKVKNTLPSPLGNIHRGKLSGDFKESTVEGIIDSTRRFEIKKNHTATHILHRVLKDTLGEWVKQEGSLVAPDHFRFDYTHPEPLKEQEIERIEEQVNRIITEARPVRREILSYNEAIKRGAVALFTEEYGEEVRMVSIENFSRELCGGTHLQNTVEAGLFKITSETGIASGVRRIEGVTGWSTYKWIRETEEIIQELTFLLETEPKALPQRIKKTMEMYKKEQKKKEKLEDQLVSEKLEKLSELIKASDGYRYIAERVKGTKKYIRKLASRMREKNPETLGLLAGEIDSSVFTVVYIGEKLKDKFDANEIIRKACGIIGGGGGGSKLQAEGGGSRTDKIDRMLEEFPRIIKESV